MLICICLGAACILPKSLVPLCVHTRLIEIYQSTICWQSKEMNSMAGPLCCESIMVWLAWIWNLLKQYHLILSGAEWLILLVGWCWLLVSETTNEVCDWWTCCIETGESYTCTLLCMNNLQKCVWFMFHDVVRETVEDKLDSKMYEFCAMRLCSNFACASRCACSNVRQNPSTLCFWDLIPLSDNGKLLITGPEIPVLHKSKTFTIDIPGYTWVSLCALECSLWTCSWSSFKIFLFRKQLLHTICTQASQHNRTWRPLVYKRPAAIILGYRSTVRLGLQDSRCCFNPNVMIVYMHLLPQFRCDIWWCSRVASVAQACKNMCAL